MSMLKKKKKVEGLELQGKGEEKTFSSMCKGSEVRVEGRKMRLEK